MPGGHSLDWIDCPLPIVSKLPSSISGLRVKLRLGFKPSAKIDELISRGQNDHRTRTLSRFTPTSRIGEREIAVLSRIQ